MKVASALLALYVSTGAVASDVRVVPELSKRSGIPVAELNELLSDCSKHQLSMNICAFQDFVAADLSMGDALRQAIARLPKGCGVQVIEAQGSWERRRDMQCNREADDETGGSGSMRPMIYSSCRASATKDRIAVIGVAKSCQALVR